MHDLSTEWPTSRKAPSGAGRDAEAAFVEESGLARTTRREWGARACSCPWLVRVEGIRLRPIVSFGVREDEGGLRISGKRSLGRRIGRNELSRLAKLPGGDSGCTTALLPGARSLR